MLHQRGTTTNGALVWWYRQIAASIGYERVISAKQEFRLFDFERIVLKDHIRVSLSLSSAGTDGRVADSDLLKCSGPSLCCGSCP